MNTSTPLSNSWSGIRAAIALCALGTAGIHLFVGIDGTAGEGLLPVFALNAAGYLGLLAAAYAPMAILDRVHRAARWALVVYTVLTIALWALGGPRVPIAYADKVIELALLALLIADIRANRRGMRPGGL